MGGSEGFIGCCLDSYVCPNGVELLDRVDFRVAMRSVKDMGASDAEPESTAIVRARVGALHRSLVTMRGWITPCGWRGQWLTSANQRAA